MTTPSIEEPLSRLESRLDEMVTKEDLAQFEARLIKWIVGASMTSAIIAATLTALIN